MNIKYLGSFILALTLLSLSSCGMKRALTLPKKDAEKTIEKSLLD